MRCARVSRVHRTVERLTSCEGSVSVGGRGAVARTTLPLHCVHSIAEQVLRRPRRRPCEPDAGRPSEPRPCPSTVDAWVPGRPGIPSDLICSSAINAAGSSRSSTFVSCCSWKPLVRSIRVSVCGVSVHRSAVCTVPPPRTASLSTKRKNAIMRSVSIKLAQL
jgi:hypothetical protein